MLAIRGGAEKLLFADPRPELNGRTLAEVAVAWELPVPATVRRILTAGNAAVMNLDLYDIENTRYLARQLSEGTVHVLVNGRFAIRDGEATGALAGRPIRRPGATGPEL